MTQQGSWWLHTPCSWVRGFLAPAEGFQISDHYSTRGFKSTLTIFTNDSSMCGFMWVSILPAALSCTPCHSTAPFLPLHSPCSGLQHLQSRSPFFKSFPVWIWWMVSFFKLIPSAFYHARLLRSSFYWWGLVSSCIIGLINFLSWICPDSEWEVEAAEHKPCFSRSSVVFKMRPGSVAWVCRPKLALLYSLGATLQM